MSAEPGAGREAVTVDALPSEVATSLARIAYETWQRERGVPGQTWHLLTDAVQAHWKTTALAVAEAAAPHLALAEQARLRGAYVCRRHGWEHCEDITCQMLADAVAAEREHCAQLAEQHAATGSKCAKGIAPNPSSDCWCRAARPRFAFAALLRRGGEGGPG